MTEIKEKQIETIVKQGKKLELDEKEAKATAKEKTNFKEFEIFTNTKGKEFKHFGEINSNGKGYWVDEK